LLPTQSRGEHLAPFRGVEHAPVHDDRPDPLRVPDIHQRVAVDQDEIGKFPRLHGADRIGNAEEARRAVDQRASPPSPV